MKLRYAEDVAWIGKYKAETLEQVKIEGIKYDVITREVSYVVLDNDNINRKYPPITKLKQFFVAIN